MTLVELDFSVAYYDFVLVRDEFDPFLSLFIFAGFWASFINCYISLLYAS